MSASTEYKVPGPENQRPRYGYDMPELHPACKLKVSPNQTREAFRAGNIASLIGVFENSVWMEFRTTEDIMKATTPDLIITGPHTNEKDTDVDLESVATDLIDTIFDVIPDPHLAQRFLYEISDNAGDGELIFGPIIKPYNDKDDPEASSYTGTRFVYKNTKKDTLIMFSVSDEYPVESHIFISAPNTVRGSLMHLYSHLRVSNPEDTKCLETIAKLYPGQNRAVLHGTQLIIYRGNGDTIIYNHNGSTPDCEHEIFVKQDVQLEQPSNIIIKCGD